MAPCAADLPTFPGERQTGGDVRDPQARQPRSTLIYNRRGKMGGGIIDSFAAGRSSLLRERTWNSATKLRGAFEPGAARSDALSLPALIATGSAVAAARREMKHHVLPRRLADRAPRFEAVPVVHQQLLRELALLPEDLRRKAMALRREMR